MRRITGGKDGMEWGIIGGFGVEWASSYSWTPTSQHQHCQGNIVSNVCLWYTCPNRKSFTPRASAVSSPRPPSAHALSLLSLFYALGAHLLYLKRLVARTKSHCERSSAHRALHLALPRRVRHARCVSLFSISSALHVPLLTCLLSSNSCQRPHSNVFILTKWKKGL